VGIVKAQNEDYFKDNNEYQTPAALSVEKDAHYNYDETLEENQNT
jgi:hypothetical protein